MSDFNYVILVGRLIANPEFKIASNNNTFATFTIANNRRYRGKNNELADETSFINLIAWGKLSDFVKNYLRKGMQIAVEGRLKQNTWTNSEGKKQSSMVVVVNNIQILTPKKSEISDTKNEVEESYEDVPLSPESLYNDSTEDDIPF